MSKAEFDQSLFEYVQDNGPCRYQELERAFDYGFSYIAASVNRLLAAGDVRLIDDPSSRRPLIAAK